MLSELGMRLPISIALVLVSALVPGCSWPNPNDSSGETETGEHSSGVSSANTSSGVIEVTGTGSSADSGTTDGAANTGEVTVSTSGPATGTTGAATTREPDVAGPGTSGEDSKAAGNRSSITIGSFSCALECKLQTVECLSLVGTEEATGLHSSDSNYVRVHQHARGLECRPDHG